MQRGGWSCHAITIDFPVGHPDRFGALSATSNWVVWTSVGVRTVQNSVLEDELRVREVRSSVLGGEI